jgi:hypothetical protein
MIADEISMIADDDEDDHLLYDDPPILNKPLEDTLQSMDVLESLNDQLRYTSKSPIVRKKIIQKAKSKVPNRKFNYLKAN